MLVARWAIDCGNSWPLLSESRYLQKQDLIALAQRKTACIADLVL